MRSSQDSSTEGMLPFTHLESGHEMHINPKTVEAVSPLPGGGCQVDFRGDHSVRLAEPVDTVTAAVVSAQ